MTDLIEVIVGFAAVIGLGTLLWMRLDYGPMTKDEQSVPWLDRNGEPHD